MPPSPYLSECDRVLLLVRKLNTLQAVWNDDEGEDLSEYALLVAVILLIIAGAVIAIGAHANAAFKTIFNSGAGTLTGR